MGASSGFDRVQAKDADNFKDAYNKAVAEATEMYGNDPYNGTISTTNGCKEIACPYTWDDDNDAACFVCCENILDNKCEKWGPAVGFTTPDGDYVFVYWAAE